MKKKHLKLLLLSIPGVALAIATTTSCNNGNRNPVNSVEEEHGPGEYEYNEIMHTRKCKDGCGNIYEEEPHSLQASVEKEPTLESEGLYVEKCVCGYKIESKIRKLVESDKDLVYELSSDGESYRVIGCKTQARRVDIPSTHEGKPVTYVAPRLFSRSDAPNLISVTIPASVKEVDGSFDSQLGIAEVYDLSGLLSMSTKSMNICHSEYAESWIIEDGDWAYIQMPDSFMKKNYVAISKISRSKVVARYYGSSKEVEIPSDATNILEYAFLNQTFSKLTLPKNLMLYDYSLAGCKVDMLFNYTSTTIEAHKSNYGNATMVLTTSDGLKDTYVVGDYLVKKEEDKYVLLSYTGKSKILRLPETLTIGEETITEYDLDVNFFEGAYLYACYLPNSLKNFECELNSNIKNILYLGKDEDVEEMVRQQCSASYRNSWFVDPYEYYTEGDYTFVKTPYSKEYYLVDYSGDATDLILPDFVGKYEISEVAFKNINVNSITLSNQLSYFYSSCFSSNNIQLYVNDVYTECRLESLWNVQKTEYENGKYIGTKDNPYLILVGLDDVESKSYKVHPDCERITLVDYSYHKVKSIELSDKIKLIDGFSDVLTEDFVYNEKDGSKYIGNSNNPYLALCKAASKQVVQVEEGCRIIMPNSLSNTDIQKVVFPDTVVAIGTKAASSNSNLISMQLPKNVEYIGDNAFYYYKGTINSLPESLKYIGNYAFGYSTLKELSTSTDTKMFSNSFSKIETLIASPGKNVNYDNYIRVTDIVFEGTSEELSVFLNDSSSIQAENVYILQDGQKHFFTEVSLPEGTTKINDGVFSGLSQITKVTLPSTLKSIGKEAFYNCSKLSEIEIPDSVESIGYGAFRECSSLVNVSLPENLTCIEDGTFYNCYSLKTINLPDTIESIGKSAFYNCNVLELKALPSSLKTLSANALYSCRKVEVESLPKSVTYIGGSALESVTVKNFVHNKSIEYETYALSGLNSSKVDLTGIEEIKENMFLDSSIDQIILSDSLTTIGRKAFYDSSIKNITIPASVTEIGDYALSTSSLIEIYNLSNVQLIVDDGDSSTKDPYHYGRNVLKVHTSAEEPSVIIQNGDFLFTNVDGVLTLKKYSGTSEDLVIPSITDLGLTGITEYIISKFTSNVSYKTVTIPEGVTEIGASAFSSSYATVHAIPSTVKKIGIYAFYYTYFETFTLPEGLTSIGDYAFYESNLSYKSNIDKVEIPESVETIGEYAFYYNGTIEYTVSRDYEGYIFDSDATIKQKTVTKNGGNYYGNKLLSIEDKTIKSFVVEEGTTEIADEAFADCTNLESVYIPESVKKVGNYLFTNDEKLFHVYVGSNGFDYSGTYWNQIGTYRYAGVTYKTKYDPTTKFAYQISSDKAYVHGYLGTDGALVLPKEIAGVTCDGITQKTQTWTDRDAGLQYTYGAFAYSSVITSVTMEEGASYSMYISPLAFAYCKNITTVSITCGVGSNAFLNCTSLTTVTVTNTNNPTVFHEGAFRGCTALTTVSISGLCADFEAVFDGCTALSSLTLDQNRWVKYSQDSNTGKVHSYGSYTFTSPEEAAAVFKTIGAGYAMCNADAWPSLVEIYGTY